MDSHCRNGIDHRSISPVESSFMHSRKNNQLDSKKWAIKTKKKNHLDRACRYNVEWNSPVHL